MHLYVSRAFSNALLSVLKSVKEEVFWRNYFYRVSLIKQSAQLTALAAQQQASGKEEKSRGTEEDLPLTGMFGEDFAVCLKKRVTFKIFLETLMSLSSCTYQKCHCNLLENSFLSSGTFVFVALSLTPLTCLPQALLSFAFFFLFFGVFTSFYFSRGH